MVKQFHDTPPKPCKYPAECTWIDSHGRIRDEATGRGVDLSAPYGGAPTISCPWPNTPKEQQYLDKICELQRKVDKFPWYELGCGFAIGSLFWGTMFALFGG
ncbi:hypothetical protein vBVpaMR16F_177 [Vibrio phage vB_VpaM_R16F]|nr:hypothetical protein vBVpaMR16F_177 [Vibrio phage vB_VpaM_R16F]